MSRFVHAVGVLLALSAPVHAQSDARSDARSDTRSEAARDRAQEEPVAEWIWDAPRERWVALRDVRRFVTAEGEPALGAGFAGQASEQPAAALPRQDLTVAGVSPRGRIVLRGRLAALRVVKLAPGVGRGPAQEHALGLISFEDGHAELVDLGPTDALEGAPLEVGRRIVVRAVPGSIDGQPALMAESLQAGGKRWEVDWAAAWGLAPRPAGSIASIAAGPPADLSSGAGSQQVVRGRLSSAQELEVDGQRRRAAEVTCDDGRRVLVVLGPGATLEALGVRPGDRVVVRGRWARVGGRQALTVESLEPAERR